MWDWINAFQQFFANLQSSIPDLGVWSYVLLGLLVATEGPLSTLIGASASAAGMLQWEWVLVATVVGNVVGDCVWYSVGYMGRMKWLYDHGRWFGMRPHHVARLEREMRLHARKLIIFAKIAYGLIVPTLVAAGLARVPWRKWFPVVFVVETLWSILLVWIGFHTTAFIQDFEQAVHAIGVTLAVGAAAFLLMRFLRRRIDQQELAMDPLADAENDVLVVAADVDPMVISSQLISQNGDSTDSKGSELDLGERQGEIHRCVALPERERVR